MAIVRRNDPVRLFGRRLLIVALAGLVVAGSFGVWGAYKKDQESAQLRREAETHLQDLTTRQDTLDDSIAKLKTDRGMEEVLRDQYALAAQGEKMIVIVDTSTSPPVATSSAFAQWLHNTFPWW